MDIFNNFFNIIENFLNLGSGIEVMINIIFISIGIMALCVFFLSNIVHSLMALIFIFVLSLMLLLILGIEFLAALILLVYIGAVVVLYLFVIMALDIRVIDLYYISWKRFVSIILLAFGFIINSIFWFIYFFFGFYSINIFYLDTFSNLLVFEEHVLELGYVLYDMFFHMFLFSSLILLVAMIGSIVLIINLKKKNITSVQYLNSEVFIYV